MTRCGDIAIGNKIIGDYAVVFSSSPAFIFIKKGQWKWNFNFMAVRVIF